MRTAARGSRRRGTLLSLLTVVVAASVWPSPASIPEEPKRWVAHYDDGRTYPDYGESIVLSPDGSRAFVSGRSVLYYDPLGRPVYITVTIAYDTATGEREWVRHAGGSLAVSPDGTRLFVATGVGVLAFGAANGLPLWTAIFEDPTGEHTDFVANSIAVSPDGSRVYVTGTSDYGDYAVIAYSAATGLRDWIVFPESSIAHSFAAFVAASPDGTKVFLAGRSKDYSSLSQSQIINSLDYMVVAFDAQTGAELWVAHHDGGSDDYVSALAVGPDGSRVYLTGLSRLALEDEELYSMETVAFESATGKKAWSARHDETTDLRNFLPALVVSRDGHRVFVAGPVGPYFDEGAGYGLIAYDAEKSGVVSWAARHDPNPDASDIPAGIAASLDGETLYVTGRAYGTFHKPATTVSVDAGNGRLRWAAAHWGEHGRGAYGAAIAVSPGGGSVYVTGAVYLYPADYDMLTIAYRSTTCADGQDEAGPVSGPLHERVEPLAGPATPWVHGVDCDVVVPVEQFW